MSTKLKTYPYNRTSAEGRRLFKLLGDQFSPKELDVSKSGRSFETYDVPTVTQCRVNSVGFIFPSNLSGIKRPQVHVQSDVDVAWGDFTKGVTVLDFKDGEELPLSYVQPIEDDTLKMLIDAGLYRDSRFEELMSKLMSDELFDAEADMRVSYLDIGDINENSLPVLMVDPIDVVHSDYDPSEHTTIASMLKRSARLAIELREEGIKTEELVAVPEEELDIDGELLITKEIEDVVLKQREREAELASTGDSIATSSELLDQEIDVTDDLRGSLSLRHTDEDVRIQGLKEQEWEEPESEPEQPEQDKHEQVDAPTPKRDIDEKMLDMGDFTAIGEDEDEDEDDLEM